MKKKKFYCDPDEFSQVYGFAPSVFDTLMDIIQEYDICIVLNGDETEDKPL